MRDEKKIMRILIENGISTKRANRLARDLKYADLEMDKKKEESKKLPTVVTTVDRVEVVKKENKKLEDK